MLRRLSSRLITAASVHPWWVLCVALALCLLGALPASKVRIDTDVLSLLPRHNPQVTAFRASLERFGSLDTLLIGVELGGKETFESRLSYVDALADELGRSPIFEWIEYQQPAAAATSFLLERAPLFLNDQELERYLNDAVGDGVVSSARILAKKARLPVQSMFKSTLQADLPGVLPVLAAHLQRGSLASGFRLDTEYYVDENATFALIVAKPRGAATDLIFDRQLQQALDQARGAADAAWRKEMDEPPPGVLYAGPYPTALEDSQWIANDITVGSITALVGVVLLFAVAFHRRTSVLIAAVPLLVGVWLTFAFAGLVIGRFSAATAAFAAMLIGLGVDYVIILYGRYIEGRDTGEDHPGAIRLLAGGAPAVLLGALTTAVTFYAFLICDFRGLYELGLLTGSGVLIVVTTVLALVPALLTLLDRFRPRREHRLLSFGLDRLTAWSQRRPKPTLVVLCVLTLVLAAAAPRMHYDDDELSLRSAESRSVRNRQRLIDAFGLSFSPWIVHCQGPDREAAMACARDLLPGLLGLIDDRRLSRVETLAAWVPSLEQQQRNLKHLAAQPLDAARLRERWTEALRQAGLAPRAFERGIQTLLHALERRRPLSLDELEAGRFANLVSRYVHSGDEGGSTVIYCYPASDDRWRLETPPALERLVAAHPGATLTGTSVVSAELRRVVRKEARLAAGLAALLVLLFLRLAMGSLRAAMVALLPLAVGLTWMAGLMGLLDLRLNFLNIFVFTMIIGIGIDYGIHVLHRARESRGSRLMVQLTSRAIAVAALTTLIGFGSLTLSHFPGLRSMGLVAIIGALCTAISATTLLPALISLAGWSPEDAAAATSSSRD